MGNPSTVREWLETLPHIEGLPDWSKVPFLETPCDSLSAAVTHTYMECELSDEAFWLGVSSYVDGDDFPSDVRHYIIKGYTAAQSAFGAQKNDHQNGLGKNQPTEEIKSDKMENLQWAEVAHHYMPTHVNQVFSLWWVKVPNDSTVYTPVPILRHIGDMTEDEDHECMLIHTRLIEDIELKRVVWSLTKQHETFDQYSTHWLLSRGFDLFGLIASGQAMRKEVLNG